MSTPQAQCMYCGQKFQKIAQAMAHRRTYHTFTTKATRIFKQQDDEPVFPIDQGLPKQCTICQHPFSGNDGFEVQSHMVSHSKNKQFSDVLRSKK